MAGVSCVTLIKTRQSPQVAAQFAAIVYNDEVRRRGDVTAERRMYWNFIRTCCSLLAATSCCRLRALLVSRKWLNPQNRKHIREKGTGNISGKFRQQFSIHFIHLFTCLFNKLTYLLYIRADRQTDRQTCWWQCVARLSGAELQMHVNRDERCWSARRRLAGIFTAHPVYRPCRVSKQATQSDTDSQSVSLHEDRSARARHLVTLFRSSAVLDPHRRRTFSVYLCPPSFCLTLPRRVLSTSWCCPSMQATSASSVAR